MPTRKQLLISGEIYHFFNRGIDRRPTFTTKREYQRALQVVRFYQFSSPPVKLSRFLSLPPDEQMRITQKLEEANDKLIEIYAFCLMPNHFHFLARQLADNGISRFMSLFHNSYTRYFNTAHKRVGPLFLDQFKAVWIETDEQLIHVSRYIHLNPYTAYVVKSFEDLFSYSWSSLAEYMDDDGGGLCNTDLVFSYFKKPEDYKKFILDQASYQRELDKIKHLTLDD
jgi:putative transposase